MTEKKIELLRGHNKNKVDENVYTLLCIDNSTTVRPHSTLSLCPRKI